MADVDTQVEVQLTTEFDKLTEQLKELKQPLADFKDSVGGLGSSVRAVRDLAQAFGDFGRVDFVGAKKKIGDLQQFMQSLPKNINKNNGVLSNFETTAARIGIGSKQMATGLTELYKVLNENLTENVEHIEKMADALAKLNSSDINLTPIKSLVNSINELTNVDIGKITAIGSGLGASGLTGFAQTLSALDGKSLDVKSLKKAINVVNELKNIDGDKAKTEIEKLNKVDLNKFVKNVQGIANKLKPLLDTITSLNKRLTRLCNNLAKVDFSVFDGAEDKVSRVVPYIQKLGDSFGTIGAGSKALSKLGRQASKDLDNTGKSAKGLKGELGALAKKLKSTLTLGNIYFLSNYLQSTFGRIGNALKSALDFTETENLFARSMNKMYDHAMKFQTKLSEMYGLAMPTMMKAQATYKNMIGNLGGLSEELSYKISEIVTKMTLDFSSLFNVDFEKASQKMQSALSKQVRPIRSVSGFDITQNVLETTARDLGIERPLRKMNELEKRMLVILTLMAQMQNSRAMNDFSRTIESPSVALYCKI